MEINKSVSVNHLNRLDSLNSEAGSVAGYVHSVCNEYREMVKNGTFFTKKYKLEEFIDRLETAEKLCNHCWSLANVLYIEYLREYENE